MSGVYEPLVAFARSRTAAERGDVVLYVLRDHFNAVALTAYRRARAELGAKHAHRETFAELCEFLRPYVAAGVLDPADAARAAHRATINANAHLVARPRMKAAAA